MLEWLDNLMKIGDVAMANLVSLREHINSLREANEAASSLKARKMKRIQKAGDFSFGEADQLLLAFVARRQKETEEASGSTELDVDSAHRRHCIRYGQSVYNESTCKANVQYIKEDE